MAPPAADAFRRERASSITVGGEQIHSVYRQPVHLGQALRIRRQTVSTERNQILNLLVEPDVELVVNGISASAIALHTDRAPAEVDVLVRSNTTDANDVDASNGVVEVAIWNGWTADEIDQGWLGEAGIRVGGTDPLILQCRDGFGTADFADLVVHIEITTPEDDDYAENRAGVTVAAGARAAAGSDAEE